MCLEASHVEYLDLLKYITLQCVIARGVYYLRLLWPFVHPHIGTGAVATDGDKFA